METQSASQDFLASDDPAIVARHDLQRDMKHWEHTNPSLPIKPIKHARELTFSLSNRTSSVGALG